MNAPGGRKRPTNQSFAKVKMDLADTLPATLASARRSLARAGRCRPSPAAPFRPQEPALICGLDRSATMPAIDDDDRPKKKLVHEIGQELTLISVKELQERIALLKEEIGRLEADIARKQASRSAADQFFKK
jgi:uncharacterized small protein (DUF1192 family)